MEPQKTKKFPQYVAGLAAAGGAFCFGTGLGWSAPAQIPLTKGKEYFPISNEEFYWITSIVSLGAAISCLPIGYLMQKFGRKYTMLSLVIPFTIGWALIIWAQNFTMMFIGRFLTGLSGGAFCISAPQYTAEIADVNIRGILGSFMELMITTGTLFIYIAGAGLNVFWLTVMCGLIPIVFAMVFIWMPESPTYLLEKGKEAKAHLAFKWLKGKQYDPSNEIEDLKVTLMEEKSSTRSFKEIISLRANQKALYVGIGLTFFQEFSAVHVVIFYATTIFDTAGAFISPDLSTIILGSLNVAATLLSALIVDKIGRKVLLLISNVGMIICLTLLGIFFFMHNKDPASVQHLGWLPLASLSVYITCFSLGFGPVPWLMLGEIFSNDLKPFAGPICGSFNWFAVFVITSFFGSVSASIGIGETFWLFAVINVSGIFFIVFSVPETKNRTLAEIQEMLGK